MSHELKRGSQGLSFPPSQGYSALLLAILFSHLTPANDAYFHGRVFTEVFDRWSDKTAPMPEWERLELKAKAREMFEFGWDNYMRHAFPLDELDPIHCTGRGPDYDDPSNININDVLGDYSLTLIDALDSLVVMGNQSEFHRAVELVLEYVSFEKDSTVQVFEATIRVLGALLSAHLILTDKEKTLGDFSLPGYNDQLLTLAHDLANRLTPAFDNTATGLPHPRVNLMYGVPWNTVNETCTSGAGSLLLEFGVLSRLLGDPTFEGLARRTNRCLWDLRDQETGLLGNQINIQTGEWRGLQSGLGAGLDSFYEYMLKSFILFGNQEDYRMFNESYSLIKEHLRRGRAHCNEGWGDPPIYVNVHMSDGATVNTWIDSLQASFAGVQILSGDVEEAICFHALYYSIWQKYGVLPERFNWQLKAPDITFYPLRPEFAEATYLLYMSTKNPFYLHVGREIIESLNEHTRVKCGYATVHDVHDKSLEDRMESFFLSETSKYLYLLYDSDNPVNKNFDRLIFTTEGHIIPVDSRFREWTNEKLFDFSIYNTPSNVTRTSTKLPSSSAINHNAEAESDEFEVEFEDEDEEEEEDDEEEGDYSEEEEEEETVDSQGDEPSQKNGPGGAPDAQDNLPQAVITVAKGAENISTLYPGCQNFPYSRRYVLPLQSRYLEQLYDMVGLEHTEN